MAFPTQRARLRSTLAIAVLATASVAHAQISLSSAVDLAYRADPKVQSAATMVVKARASLSEAKDAVVPVVGAEGGIGKSTGVPLSLPTVFTIDAKSLVFNWSQRDYIRSAHFGWDASQLALQQAQADAAEDVVNTYIALDNAQQRRVAAQAAVDHSQRLLGIVQDRVNAGQDAHIEIPRTDLTLTEMQQQLAHIDTDIATLSDHLSRLTGLTGTAFSALHDSIPTLPEASALAAPGPPASTNPGIEAAFTTARSKFELAHGDARYLYRPQLAFGASYSRITTDFSNYSIYYPAFNSVTHPGLSRNALSLGIQISLPVLDQAHRARARESAADALKAKLDAQAEQDAFLEGRLKLQRATSDLELETRKAQDQADIAQDDLEAILIQLQPNAAVPNTQPLTPKDEQKARLAIAQRQLDLLAAQLQLAQAKISLMRQNGALVPWLQSATPSPKP